MKMLLTLAALAAAPLGQPAHAEPAPATNSAVVVHSDLDLATVRGTRTLERRIWRAVVTVCGSASEYDLEGKNNVRQCRRDTLRQASEQADAVVASAKRAEPIRVTIAR